MKISDFLGLGHPPELLGMMSGEEWNRRRLALPAPTLERHLARTIDSTSLTSVPGEYRATPRSEAAKRRERSRREKEWRMDHAGYRIELRNAPQGCGLWVVSSTRQDADGSTNHTMSRMIAASEADAKRRHRAYCKQENLGKELSILAICL